MTIKMIVDECDKYELPDITDICSFICSTADSWVRSRIVYGGEVGRWQFKGFWTKSSQFNVFFLTTFNIYINNSKLEGGWCGGPDLLVQYTFFPLQNSNSTLHKFSRLYKKPTTCKQCPKHGEKKRKETVFGCVKCNKHFCSFICQRPYHAVLDVNILGE
jgi:hypothetical protein